MINKQLNLGPHRNVSSENTPDDATHIIEDCQGVSLTLLPTVSLQKSYSYFLMVSFFLLLKPPVKYMRYTEGAKHKNSLFVSVLYSSHLFTLPVFPMSLLFLNDKHF